MGGLVGVMMLLFCWLWLVVVVVVGMLQREQNEQRKKRGTLWRNGCRQNAVVVGVILLIRDT